MYEATKPRRKVILVLFRQGETDPHDSGELPVLTLHLITVCAGDWWGGVGGVWSVCCIHLNTTCLNRCMLLINMGLHPHLPVSATWRPGAGGIPLMYTH